ncbi:MAG: YqgE/AlgH family protein [Rhizobiaceae bacterium]
MKSKARSLRLKGQLLVAMPGMLDQRFARSVILICSHSGDGSMGFVLNQPVVSPKFVEILEELEIEVTDAKSAEQVKVFRGGPVEQGRGFVLHSLDYSTPASSRVEDLACVTATLDALRRLASATPPDRSIMLLGYAGWSAGQLEEEILQNGWLTTSATGKILFETPYDKQYEAALASLGISEELLSAEPGHA